MANILLRVFRRLSPRSGSLLSLFLYALWFFVFKGGARSTYIIKITCNWLQEILKSIKNKQFPSLEKVKKINELLKDIVRTPFEGLGKPEALKHKYAGFWSRRIDEEHRLIYRFNQDEIQIVKCRHHYD